MSSDRRFYAAAVCGADGTLEASPAQSYYRAMRQRELQGYRSVVRSIVMHQPLLPGSSFSDSSSSSSSQVDFLQLSRTQQRLLEDLEAELCIPATRRAAELAAASRDVVVAAVRGSGVAERRMVHFDGVTDIVPDDPIADGVSDSDEDGAFLAIKVRPANAAAAGAGAAGSAGRRGRAGEKADAGGNKPANSAAAAATVVAVKEAGSSDAKMISGSDLTNLRKLEEPVRKLCNELVLCHDPKRVAQIQTELVKHQKKLLDLRSKVAHQLPTA